MMPVTPSSNSMAMTGKVALLRFARTDLLAQAVRALADVEASRVDVADLAEDSAVVVAQASWEVAVASVDQDLEVVAVALEAVLEDPPLVDLRMLPQLSPILSPITQLQALSAVRRSMSAT